MRPFFSIIIPTLNEEKYISRILSTIEKQKNRNFEVIIVDSSNDNRTKDALYACPRTFSLTYHKTRIQNPSHQRNVGSRYAKGKYLIFLDADTQIESSFTYKLEKAIYKKKGLVYRPYTVPYEKKHGEINALFVVWNMIVEYSFTTENPLGDGACMIFERNFFDLIGGYNERLVLAEDHDIMQKCGLWGVKPRQISNIRVAFSLRRLQREGKLKLFVKYGFIILNSIFKQKTKNIAYDMGGRITDIPTGSSKKNNSGTFLPKSHSINLKKILPIFQKLFSK